MIHIVRYFVLWKHQRLEAGTYSSLQFYYEAILLFNNADSTLFKRMMINRNHVLHHLLPPVKNVPYDMRPRAHNRCLPANLTCVQKKNFINPLTDKFFGNLS